MRTAGATVRMRVSLERAFDFHADAANLAAVLPRLVPLRAIGPSRLGPGVRLRFTAGPFSGSGVVTVWEPPHRFVDEQSFGPFALWRHEHRFIRIGEATWVTDTVSFALRGTARPLEPLVAPLVRATLLAKLRRTRDRLERS